MVTVLSRTHAVVEGIINPGDVVMQSGVTGTLYSVVRWTAPHAGLIDASLSSEYGYGEFAGALLFNGNTVGTFGAANYSFSQKNIAVNAGDTFDIFMGGTVSSNMMTLDATITYVPEPATMSLLAMGAVAGLLRRKLRQVDCFTVVRVVVAGQAPPPFFYHQTEVSHASLLQKPPTRTPQGKIKLPLLYTLDLSETI